MYEKFFHLKKRPFSIAPDPGFLYMSDRHRDALAHLKYGLESDGGFVLVTGEVGTGKTTLLRNIIGEVPGDIDVAFILNPRLTVRELLQTICDELAIEYPTEDQHSVKPYIDRLNKHLLQTHQADRSTVVVIDEAQNLSPAVLEQLRLLTNLETNERKLLRIILVGQPELKAMLDRQELRQLSQRITARYHLEPLGLADTRAYLAHRLMVSGGNPNLFSNAASWNIHRHAGGIPRLINIIADRALLGAYADNSPRIDFMTSQKAARETLSNNNRALLNWVAVASVLVLAAGASWWLLTTKESLIEPRAEGNAPSAQQPATESAVTPIRQQVQDPTENRRSAQIADTIPRIEDIPLTEIEVRNEAPQISAPAPEILGLTETLAPAPEVEKPVIRSPQLNSEEAAALPAPLPGVPSYHSQRMAFETMYKLWGVEYNADDLIVPCDYAPRFQLQCTKRASNWTTLERLNVPVVLQLKTSDGVEFYAAAVGMGNDWIKLEQAGTQTDVSIRALEQSWTGTFIALWPTPESYRGSLSIGSNGQAVTELRSLLGDAIKRDLGTSKNFDAQLGRALEEFQSANGLARDGIAGPATWLLLHRAAGYDIPELLG